MSGKLIRKDSMMSNIPQETGHMAEQFSTAMMKVFVGSKASFLFLTLFQLTDRSANFLKHCNDILTGLLTCTLRSTKMAMMS